MSFFSKNNPPEPQAPQSLDFGDFEPRALQSLIKQGGKKKLDALLDMFKLESPKRVEEIEKANSAKDGAASARVLKSSAANLGLHALEDSCDQIIAAGAAFSAASPLAKRPRLLLAQALDYLENARKIL
jgi:hypothetical protein